jgi:hypothetical protein
VERANSGIAKRLVDDPCDVSVAEIGRIRGTSGSCSGLEPGAASSPATISGDGLAAGAGASRGIGCSVLGAAACPVISEALRSK